MAILCFGERILNRILNVIKLKTLIIIELMLYFFIVFNLSIIQYFSTTYKEIFCLIICIAISFLSIIIRIMRNEHKVSYDNIIVYYVSLLSIYSIYVLYKNNFELYMLVIVIVLFFEMIFLIRKIYNNLFFIIIFAIIFIFMFFKFQNTIHNKIIIVETFIVIIINRILNNVYNDRIYNKYRKSEIEYLKLYQSIEEGFIIVELIFDSSDNPINCKVLDVNSAFEKIIEIKKGDIIGKTNKEIYERMEVSWLEKYDELYREIFSINEKKYFTRFSKRINKHLRITAYRLSKNQIAVLVSDISDRINYINELKNVINIQEEANRVKYDFLNNINHEIRTPINGLTGMIDIFEMADDRDEQLEIIELMKSSVSKINNIINRISDYTSLDEKSTNYNQINIFDFIKSIKYKYEQQINNKGLKLKDEICEILPETIWCDEDKISKVLDILIENALKYTNKGKIVIKVSCLDNILNEDDKIYLMFQVVDTGVGISDEDIDRIFEEFNLSNNSYNRNEYSLGLGLPACKKLVEQMEGHISVKSELGKGSNFSFVCVCGLRS